MQRVSPPKTPQVVGKLLDLDCNEDFVRMLLQSVGAACPVEELVEQVRACVRKERVVCARGCGRADAGNASLGYTHTRIRRALTGRR